jgi:membrane protein YqaA with SNARE-associated domain
MVCIAGLAAVAVMKGIDGAVLKSAFAAIGATAGGSIGFLLGRARSRPH